MIETSARVDKPKGKKPGKYQNKSGKAKKPPGRKGNAGGKWID